MQDGTGLDSRTAVSERYSRQARFAPIGTAGQERLHGARVLVIGCGGLGSVAADIMARAGVGRLVLIDRDLVELSNLQRQCLYTLEDVEQALPKAEAARRHLQAVNPDIEIESRVTDVRTGNIEELIAGSTLILDGTDNHEARYLINDAAVKQGIPWIYAAASGSDGMTFPVLPGNGPCLRCLYPERPPPGLSETCETRGIIAPILHTIVGLQTTTALKFLSGNLAPNTIHMTVIDSWANTYRSFPIHDARLPECPCCSNHHYPYLDAREQASAERMCGRNAVQVCKLHDTPINLDRMSDQLSRHGTITRNPYVLKFTSSEISFTLFPDGRAVFEGVQDAALARRLYARYVG